MKRIVHPCVTIVLVSILINSDHCTVYMYAYSLFMQLQHVGALQYHTVQFVPALHHQDLVLFLACTWGPSLEDLLQGNLVQGDQKTRLHAMHEGLKSM